MMVRDFRYCNLLQCHQHLMIVCRQWMRRPHGTSASARAVLPNQCEWHPHEQLFSRVQNMDCHECCVPEQLQLLRLISWWSTEVHKSWFQVTEPSWLGTTNSIHCLSCWNSKSVSLKPLEKFWPWIILQLASIRVSQQNSGNWIRAAPKKSNNIMQTPLSMQGIRWT